MNPSRIIEIDNFIHPSAYVDSTIKMGINNYIGPFCHITGDTVIGDNNRFESHIVVGTSPEHKGAWDKHEWLGVRIGSNNIFREFTTIHAGAERNTKIHNRCIFLNHSHIAHDCIIYDDVTISCATLAGHVTVFRGANLGLGVVVHQRQSIGHFAMIGMNTTITKKTRVCPTGVYVGNPAVLIKTNDHAIKKYSLSTEDILKYDEEWRNSL